MGFPGSTSKLPRRMMPLWAILRHDLRTLWSSWLVRLWLVGSAVLTLLVLASGWEQFQDAPMIGAILFPYLVFPWFLVVIVLGVSPVSGSRVEALADGILSRPVTRYEYLLAVWAARVATVLGAFLVVMIPAILLVTLAERRVAPDAVTLYGILAALATVSLVLTLLVSMGFLLGTVLRRPLLAVVVLLFVWYPINLILNAFALEEFSPISLNRAIPTLLRQPWSPPETPPQDDSATVDLAAAADTMSDFFEVFSEQPVPKPKPKPGFFERDKFDDFSLTRVVLGYGLPTLAALGLATLCFCLRDF